MWCVVVLKLNNFENDSQTTVYCNIVARIESLYIDSTQLECLISKF